MFASMSKPLVLTFLFVLASAGISAQETTTWTRVYTFDDSIIEMNTADVRMSASDVARVTFRWVFDQPQTLPNQPNVKFKQQREEIDVDCLQRTYRSNGIVYFDSTERPIGRLSNLPFKWVRVGNGGMMDRLSNAACESLSLTGSAEDIQLQNAARFARSFSEALNKTKDITLLEKFFVSNYPAGELSEHDTKGLFKVSSETLQKADQADIKRLHLASLNAIYLSYMYFLSQDQKPSLSVEEDMPLDVTAFIYHHPYTANYKRGRDYHFLADTLDSIERMRSYTDLIEGMDNLLRKHLNAEVAQQSFDLQKADIELNFNLYQPIVRVCRNQCFGLPKGTRLFEVNAPVFRLQLMDVDGSLKIVSLTDQFH